MYDSGTSLTEFSGWKPLCWHVCSHCFLSSSFIKFDRKIGRQEKKKKKFLNRLHLVSVYREIKVLTKQKILISYVGQCLKILGRDKYWHGLLYDILHPKISFSCERQSLSDTKRSYKKKSLCSLILVMRRGNIFWKHCSGLDTES